MATKVGAVSPAAWQAWTIAELRSRAGLSKTVLAERFAPLVGTSPIDYLTTWRMQIAARWLKESGMTIERVAERCGYDSVPAFSKAFKRSVDISPGVYRRGRTVSRRRPDSCIRTGRLHGPLMTTSIAARRRSSNTADIRRCRTWHQVIDVRTAIAAYEWD